LAQFFFKIIKSPPDLLTDLDIVFNNPESSSEMVKWWNGVRRSRNEHK